MSWLIEITAGLWKGRQVNLQRWIFTLVPLAVILFALYWLMPRFTFHDLSSLSPQTKREVLQFMEGVRNSVEQTNNPPKPDSQSGPNSGRRSFTPSCFSCTDYQESWVALTPLVNLLVKVPIEVPYDLRSEMLTVASPQYYPVIRFDNVVFFCFIFIGVILGAKAIRIPLESKAYALVGHQSDMQNSKSTAEEYLEADVDRAEERARDMYKRSTILLGGGIIMAFVGVALFYLTLQPSSSDSQTSSLLAGGSGDSRDTQLRGELDYQRYLFARQHAELEELRSRVISSKHGSPPSDYGYPRYTPPVPSQPHDEHPWLQFASHSLRPTGMLIFMEGIAWFLLRQYRVLIQEYKSFLQIYLKRSNYLIAWKAALAGDEKCMNIAQAMIRDGVTEIIKRDETTEVLEAMRVAEPSPIVEVLREVKGLVPKLNK